MAGRRPALSILLNLTGWSITCASLFIFLNGSLLSPYEATHIDLSINLTASDALRDGATPYGITTLAERAASLGSPTLFVYSQLFTSYIQPPTSALTLLPLTTLPWREATQLYLYLNNLFLFAAAAIVVLTVRSPLSLAWRCAAVTLLLAIYSQIYTSFALGQVDATILLLITLSFWAYSRGLAPLCGACIALAATIKLIPGLIVLYFLWKRDYKYAGWSLLCSLVFVLLSIVYVGPDIYSTYITDTLPAVLKGSTHYTNVSLGAVIARITTDGYVGSTPEILSLSELDGSLIATMLRIFVALSVLAFLAVIIRRRRGTNTEQQVLFSEFYLLVTAGLLISSITWEFYVVWLLPIFIAVLVKPEWTNPYGIWRWIGLGVLLLALLVLNYPGDCSLNDDCYLYVPNTFFYHPEWVPGVFVERQVSLYSNHLDAVIYLRLLGLTLVMGLLTLFILGENRRLESRRQ